MSPRYRRILLLCGLLPTLAAALLSLTRPAALVNLEFFVYDTLVRWTPTRLPSGKVVIVDVDEKSLARVGQWPWRRDIIGRLIDSLRDRGAAAVALDILFPETDRFEGSGISPDAVLSDSLRRGRVILGYGLLFDPTRDAPKPCVQHALGLPIIRSAGVQTDDPFFQATSAVCNIPTLTAAAQASGFLNAAPDPDGILRRAPLLMQYDERVYPALALAAVRSTNNAQDLVLRIANVNTASLGLAGLDVPLDGKSNLLLRYRGAKRTFPYISAVDILEGHVDPSEFHDRIVFVGTTALGTREVVATPLDTLFVGVEVQATVADNLLQRDSSRDRSRHCYCAHRRAVRPRVGCDRRDLVPDRGVDGIAVTAGNRRRLLLSALPIHEPAGEPCSNDRSRLRSRAPACRARWRRQGQVAPPDGADAVVVDRHSRPGDRPSLQANAEVHEGHRRGVGEASQLPGLPDA